MKLEIRSNQHWWPALAAIAVFMCIEGIFYNMVMTVTAGHFVYLLDDAYIHAAIAKHLVTEGFWGLTPYAWSSSSSSILWTMILALVDSAFGIHSFTPFVLNLLCGILSIVMCDVVLARYGVTDKLRLVTLLFIIFVCPLPLLVFSGMEHTLQILIDLVFTYLAASVIAESQLKPVLSARTLLLVLAASLVAFVRYEGLFLILAAAIILLIYRRYLVATLISASAALPVIMYGLISKSRGSLLLPNSVLIKGAGAFDSISAFLVHFTQNIWPAGYLAVMPLLALISLWPRIFPNGPLNPRVKAFVGIYGITAVLHLCFGAVGWLNRYEAYLIVMGTVALVASFVQRSKSPESSLRSPIKLLIPCLVLGTIGGLAGRAVSSLTLIPSAAEFTYLQQFQTATFLNRFYSNASIAANDVGAINYYADLHCLDLWGIGDIDVVRLKLDHAYNAQQIDTLTRSRGVQIAVLYEGWFQDFGGIPRDWQLIGQWRVPCVYCGGGNIVSFFAVDPHAASYLEHSLREFSTVLPNKVEQIGPYTDSSDSHNYSR